MKRNWFGGGISPKADKIESPATMVVLGQAGPPFESTIAVKTNCTFDLAMNLFYGENRSNASVGPTDLLELCKWRLGMQRELRIVCAVVT